MKEKSSKNNIFMAFMLNLFFSIVEFVGGIFTNSISIISDSIHDFGDAISIAVAWFLEKKSEKKPDKKYTFGYARYSVLGALITSTVLLVGSVVMIYNAVPRIINPVEVNYDGMLILGILGLFINGAGALVTSKGEKINEKAVSLHLLEDVLGWIAVLVVSVIMKVFNIPVLDPILSILITVYILWHVVRNFKSVFEIFLEKAPESFEFEEFKKELMNENKEIKNIHHIHIWSVDGVNTYVMMHVVVSDDIQIPEIISLKKKISDEALHHKIVHTTIEIEFESEKCENEECDVKINEEMRHAHHHHHY